MEHQDTIHIWDGAVGVRIREVINRKSNERFHNFEFVRCYKTDDSDEMRYSNTFTERNAEALGRVIRKTLTFIAESYVDESERYKNIIGKIDVVKVPADQALA